jgi:adenosylmethionine-8-amino-7-oxononanoate aminotransferase
MQEKMQPLEQLACVKETRFLGMIGVVELHSTYAEQMPHIKQVLREAGYLFRPLGTVLYLMPPLIISLEELSNTIDALALALPQD